MAQVTIGCKLPHGLVLEHPTAASVKPVTINGSNKELIIGSGYGTTQVDAEFWKAWKEAHKGFAALVSGSIFESGNAASIASAAKEVESEKTGFERMPQKAMGINKRSDKD